MRTHIVMILVTLTVVWAHSVLADTVTSANGVRRGVLVMEGNARYYVLDPNTGTTTSLAKTEVIGEGVQYSPPAEREALWARWHETRAEIESGTESVHSSAGNTTQDSPSVPSLPVASTPPSAERDRKTESTPVLRLRGNARPYTDSARYAGPNATDGVISYVHLQDVPLGTALQAMLRPLNLAYEKREGYLFISTPDRLRRESTESLETRFYSVYDDNEALPKVVVRNPQGAIGGTTPALGVGTAGGLGGFAGFGAGGFGGFSPGFGAGRGIAPNVGGLGVGFGGSGMGGFGFGGVGLGRDVTQISNISDLFSTIDDRLVGETPAVIGTVYGVRHVPVSGRAQAFPAMTR